MKFYFCGIIVLSLPLHPASVISRLPPSMAVTCPDNFLSLRPIAQLLHSTKCFAVCLQWTCVRLRWDGVYGDHVTVFQYITSKRITFHREGVSSSCDTVSLICQTPWPLCPGQPGLNITLHYITLQYKHFITLHSISLWSVCPSNPGLTRSKSTLSRFLFLLLSSFIRRPHTWAENWKYITLMTMMMTMTTVTVMMTLMKASFPRRRAGWC